MAYENTDISFLLTYLLTSIMNLNIQRMIMNNSRMFAGCNPTFTIQKIYIKGEVLMSYRINSLTQSSN